MDLTSKGGRLGHFFFQISFFLSSGKNDHQKHRNLKKKKKIWHFFFLQKFWKSIVSYFQTFLVKFSLTLAQKQLILYDFSKVKKNLPKWKIWVGLAHKTGFSFFVAWCLH